MTGRRVAGRLAAALVSAAVALVPAAVALVLAGCAPIGGSGAMGGVSPQVATAETTHEYPSPKPPAEHAPAAPSAEAAILAFTDAYINWSARGLPGDLRRLALASVGQARSAMVLAAADTAGDDELARSGIANHGTVEAIAPLAGTANQYVVVTQESTTASATDAYQGLRPAWHITLATVRRAGPSGWVLSGWQPEG